MATPHPDLIDRAGSGLGGLLYRRGRLFGRSLEGPPLHEAVPATTVEVDGLQPGVVHAIAATGMDDCDPLLARHDQLVELDKQRHANLGRQLLVIDRDHFTGIAATDELCAHIGAPVAAALGHRVADPGGRGG